MANFITDIVDLNSQPCINVKVFSKYTEDNYDVLDALAKAKGYLPVEPAVDTKIETEGAVGMCNRTVHSGWIATVDDGFKVQAEAQVKLLNKKIQHCKQQLKQQIIVGFCQTGKFSIGYTVYVKGKVQP